VKTEQVKETAEVIAAIPPIAWITIIIVAFIILGIAIVLKFDKLSKFFFGSRKGVLVKKEEAPENVQVDVQESQFIQYVSSWTHEIKLSESVKISPIENLHDFFKSIIDEISSKKVSAKKLVINLVDTEKMNSSAVKDITSLIELCIEKYPQIDLTILLSKEPSEQIKLSQSIWTALINSHNTSGGSDINVHVIC
jgi:hypothetical protein